MAAGSWICLSFVLLLPSLLPTKTTAQDQTENNTGSCAVQFLTQPPEDLPCNPYEPSFNRLRLQCDVAIPRNGNNLRVRWYRLRHRGDQPENILNRDNPTFVVRRRRFLDDQIIMTSWLHVRNVTEEDMGIYWCQLDDEDEATVHRPCTVTHLAEAAQYSDLAACSRTFFFSLGPVCVHPHNDCPTEWSTNPSNEKQPDPSPSSSSSRHSSTHGIAQESNTPTTQVDMSSDMLYWYIPVIAGVTLIILLTLGLVMLISAVLMKKKRCTRTSVTPAPPSVHVQNLQSQLPCSQNQSSPPLHLNVARQTSHDSNYAIPGQLQRPIHSQQCHSGLTWSDDQIDSLNGNMDCQASLGEKETKEARRHLQTVERDGNAYLVISRSPTSTSDEVLDYTVPSMAMQSVNMYTSTNTDSAAVEEESEFEVSHHAYENEPAPRYAPLRSDTLDQARMYSLPMSKRCQCSYTQSS